MVAEAAEPILNEITIMCVGGIVGILLLVLIVIWIKNKLSDFFN